MVEVQERKGRRGGGRAARVAARAAALPDDVRPIRPGMEGGTLKVLSEAQVLQIHNAALEALETIGLADAPQSGIDLKSNPQMSCKIISCLLLAVQISHDDAGHFMMRRRQVCAKQIRLTMPEIRQIVIGGFVLSTGLRLTMSDKKDRAHSSTRNRLTRRF